VDVKWGSLPEEVVRHYPHNPDMIQMVGNSKKAATGVLHWPDVWMTMLTRKQAKKLGYALIRVANDRG
jgi:hypothetical protein